MRIFAVIVAMLLVACGAPPAMKAPATVPAEKPAITMLASEGGVLRPIANGGRVALRNGWATVEMSPSSVGEADLKVVLYGADGAPMTGEVKVDYESMDMDHGKTMENGVFHGGCYQMHLSFAMPGAWRLVLHVARAGSEEKVTLVLPDVGF